MFGSFKQHLRARLLGSRNKVIIHVTINLYLFIKFKFEILSNFRYFSKRWSSLSDAEIPLTSMNQITPNEGDCYVFNPTIINWNNELLCFARISNLSLRPHTNFWEKDQNKYKTLELKNGICSFSLNSNFEITNYRTLVPISNVPNLEDPKVFIHNEKLLLTCNYVVQHPNESGDKLICKVVIYDLDRKEILQLEGPTNRNIEKNWIPMPIDGPNLNFIYDSLPDSIYRIEANSLKGIMLNGSPKKLFNYHGGSQFLQISEFFYIRIVREKRRLPKKGLVTLSYILVYNSNLEYIKTIGPFIFRIFGFEICNGITISGDSVIFSWGENDHKMFVGEIKIDKLLTWIEVFDKNQNSKRHFWKLRRDILTRLKSIE